jgi:preprotein translocase subunit YajC
MFVSPALAQAGGEAAAGPDAFMSLLPIVLIFVVFYFLLIRPQQKKLKQHKEMLAAIRRGDRVVTGGGIIGTVTKVVDDNEIMLEIAEGVRVRVQRAMISTVLTKPEPVSESKAGREASKESAVDETSEAAETPPAEGSPPAQSGTTKRRRLLGGKSE